MIALAVAAVMAVFPGAVVASVMGRFLDPLSRIALCVALSPLVVAVTFLGLLAVGAEAATAAFAPLLLAIGGCVLMVRDFWRSPGEWPEMQPPGLILGLLVLVPFAWLAVHWLSVPELRAFGYHNLLQVDIVYSLLRTPPWPEEPELAGWALEYAWLRHAAWAAVGLVTDRPPTLMYPVENLLLAAASMRLVFSTSRFRGGSVGASLIAGVLALLAGHSASDLAALQGADATALQEMFGDPRLAAALDKFLYLDAMPVSIALTAALFRVSLQVRAQAKLHSMLLFAIVLVASALMYPIGLPTVVGWLASLAAVQWFFAASRSDLRERGVALSMAGVGILALALAGLWLRLDGGQGVIDAMSGEVASRRLGNVAIALGPLLLLGLPGLIDACRRGDPVVVALVVCVVGHAFAYSLLSARGLEYKFVIYARLPLALAIGASIDVAARRSSALVPSAAGVVALAALAGAVASLGRSWPPSFENAFRLDERHFQLDLPRDDPRSAWIRAVRDQTPDDTFLIAYGTGFHAGVFANRSLYYPGESAGANSPGVSLWSYGNLVHFRGHPEIWVKERYRDVVAIARDDDSGDLRDAVQAVRALGRPVAIRLASEASGRAEQLRDLGARLVHRDAKVDVWLFDAAMPPATP